MPTPVPVNDPRTFVGLTSTELALVLGGPTRWVAALVLDLHARGVTTTDSHGRVALRDGDAGTDSPYRSIAHALPPHERQLVEVLQRAGPLGLPSIRDAMKPVIKGETIRLRKAGALVHLGSWIPFAVVVAVGAALFMVGLSYVLTDPAQDGFTLLLLPLIVGWIAALVRPAWGPNGKVLDEAEGFRVELDAHVASGVPGELMPRHWIHAVHGRLQAGDDGPARYAALVGLDPPALGRGGGGFGSEGASHI